MTNNQLKDATWITITTTAETLTSTSFTYSTTAPDAKTTYYFKAEDIVGNISYAGPITVQKDTTAPSGTVTYSLNGTANENYIDNSGTIKYKAGTVTQLTLTLSSIADNPDQSGLEGIYLNNSKLTSTSNPKLESDNTVVITLATEDAVSNTYTITAKDNIGNTSNALISLSLTSDGSATDLAHPVTDPATAPVQTENGQVYYKSGDTTYYIRGSVAIVKFAKPADDTVKYMWNDGSGYTEFKTDTTAGTTLSVEGSIASLKFPISDSDSAKTYSFYVIDNVGNEGTAKSIKLKKATTAPSGSISSYAVKKDSTGATLATASTIGDYIVNGSLTEAGNITITYNPTNVNKVTITPGTINDCGAGSFIVLKVDNVEQNTTYTSAFDIEMGTTGKTCEIIARDNVGNETSLKTFVFTAKATGVAPAIVSTAKYNNADRNHISNNSYTLAENDRFITNPDNQGASHTIVVPNYSINLPISLASTSVVSDKVFYAVTYIANSNSLPTPAAPTENSAWTLGSVQNGKITVSLNGAEFPGDNNYIFVWFKDMLGNSSDYGLSYNFSRENTWWAVDKAGPTDANASLQLKNDDGNTNTDQKYYKSTVTDDVTVITYNPTYAKKLNFSANPQDNYVGLSSSYLFYRVKNATEVVDITNNRTIALSSFTDSTEYELIAKDKWNNVSVLKTFKLVADNSITVTYTYTITKDGESNPAKYYTVGTEGDYTLITYNNTKLGGGKFTVQLQCSENIKEKKKKVNNGNEEDFNGEIGLNLNEQNSTATFILIAYDDYGNRTEYAKLKFAYSSTLEVQENRISTRSVGIMPSSEIFKFAESSGSAALQSRIVELPVSIQNVWENYTSTTNEVVETVSSSAKKSAKKAAKQAKAAVKATANKPAETAVETVAQAATDIAAALEVTELPVETLVAPAPEDAVAMLLPQSANTKQTEPQASVSTALTDTAAVTTADELPQENLVLKLIIALAALVLCGAFGVTLLLKKKSVQEK